MKTAQACQVNGGCVSFLVCHVSECSSWRQVLPVFDRPICRVTLFMKSRTFAAENQGKSKK